MRPRYLLAKDSGMDISVGYMYLMDLSMRYMAREPAGVGRSSWRLHACGANFALKNGQFGLVGVREQGTAGHVW